MNLHDHLKGSIPSSLLHLLPGGYEVIGDTAIFSVPEELSPFCKDIGAAIIRTRRNITTVLRRVSKRQGERRTASYEPVIGTGTRTIHQESGFRYHVDVATSFFTTRLASERQRIASMVQPGETVLVPFAGVGPFIIPAAFRGERGIAIELNPDACNLLRRNISLNHLEQKIMIIRGDAMFGDQMLNSFVDRAIIPTPYGLDLALGPVSRLVRPGGWIHFYTFKNRAQAMILRDRFSSQGFFQVQVRRCGNVAPSVSRWVFDMQKE